MFWTYNLFILWVLGFLPWVAPGRASKRNYPLIMMPFLSLILLCYCVCSLFISLLLPPNCQTPFFSSLFLIYSFRIVAGSSLPPDPTHVGGAQVDYS